MAVWSGVGFGALARDIGRGRDRKGRPFGDGDSVLATILDVLELNRLFWWQYVWQDTWVYKCKHDGLFSLEEKEIVMIRIHGCIAHPFHFTVI
jgi:hypothetical protein